MSECQSKCACGDICRRVDEHLQHQCPKCNYEQHWTVENIATAPASTAATPLREANQQRVDAAAQRVRQRLYRYSDDDTFRKDVELLIEIALAPVLEIFAAAQPQRESEQPELPEVTSETVQQCCIAYGGQSFSGPMRRALECHLEILRAAHSPQTDSQEQNKKV